MSAEAELVTADRLMSAALFTTLAVTIWTTVLIAYRIYSTSDLILNRRTTRFRRILEIIIQSSLIYSLALGPSALIGIIKPQQFNFTTLLTASFYLDTISVGVAVR